MSIVTLISLKAWKKKQIKRQDDLHEELKNLKIKPIEKDKIYRNIANVEGLIRKIEKEIEKEERKTDRVVERRIKDVFS